MVFVNDKKFAWSSSCHHTERPLFEVKKKGRPVSQCPKCRELRQAKRVHSKCTCAPRQAVVDKIPIPAARPDKKPFLLYLMEYRMLSTLPRFPFLPIQDSGISMCRWIQFLRGETCASWTTGPRGSGGHVPRPTDAEVYPSALIGTILIHITTPPQHLELPPILPGSISSSGTVPYFSVIPPLSTIKSIAGSGCTCGFRCMCPGCIEHRGPEHAQADHKDCSDGCAHCVDHTGGVELPGQDTSVGGGSLVEMFFARAASLPNPPLNRRMGMDPGDVTVYPSDLFSGSSMETDDRSAAFGLVNIPKLECCRGQCGCASEGCVVLWEGDRCVYVHSLEERVEHHLQLYAQPVNLGAQELVFALTACIIDIAVTNDIEH
ncbi:hypothetical protein BU15DRAFT_65271 [Melanogaster broomeanus]|nr:hypothetical protein BU15DRAFT_65271 [Melanogaster broomeanus]